MHTYHTIKISIKSGLIAALFGLTVFTCPVQAQSAASLPSSTDQGTLGIVMNYRKAHRTHDQEAGAEQWMPSGDPSGGAGGGGASRFMQTAPAPPVVKTNDVTPVPPTPTTFVNPQVTVTNNLGSAGQNSVVAKPAYKGDGLPETAGQRYAVLDAALAMNGIEKNAPENTIPKVLAIAQLMTTSAANSFGTALQGPPGSLGGSGGAGGGGGGGSMAAALNAILGMPTPALINVANENSGSAILSTLQPFKTIPQAVWMVQQMYKNFSIPLALLLLLPGAVITQLKAQIAANFNLKTEDATSPFEGILRGMIALFLIPCTQLIVSYSIDVGNSLAYTVNPAVQIMPILGWLQQVAYTTLPSNNSNALVPSGGGPAQAESPDGGGASPFMSGSNPLSSAAGGILSGGGFGGGLASGQSDDQSKPEGQSNLSSTLETMFNVMMYMFSIGILVMTAFQLVIMCYLYLLGPVAAAFFAWPTVKGKIFRPVFGNWVNAVITVSLWRFYWMVILAIMTNRIMNLGENGSMLFNLQWEVAVFTCLIGLLFYVPMNPWNFDPGQAYRSAKFFGESVMQAASKGGGGGGGGKGGGGKESGGGEKQSAGSGGTQSASGGAGKGQATPTAHSTSPTPSGSDGKSSAMPTVLASTSGSPAESSSTKGTGGSTSKEMGGNTSSGKSEAPPLEDKIRSLASNTGTPTSNPNNEQGNNGSSQSQKPGSSQSEPPVGQLAMLTPSSAGAGANGATSSQNNNSGASPNAGHMPYSPIPASGEQGSAAAPVVTANPNLPPDTANSAVAEGLRQNYGNLGAATAQNSPPVDHSSSPSADEKPPALPPSKLT